jgi:homopolymeric O-antigen transport system ATP-binding protein
MANSVEVELLSKQYTLGELHTNDLLQDRLVRWLKQPFTSSAAVEHPTLWALRDVSFQIRQGEVVGIIGRNGSGKSTLLKLLSRITYPTSGHVNVTGRIGALLEVGTGFHGDLTGRENIYLNGSILGMRKREVDAKLDAIAAFAGVERFLDTPVRHYSTGMFLRLGFAVAAHLEPDVLLVDEVLAVGDAGFQKKCLNAMDEMRSSGRTVLFVSHNMAAIENLCSRVIWLDGGRLLQDGAPREVLESYMRSFNDVSRLDHDLRSVATRRGNGFGRFTRLQFLNGEGEPLNFVRSGDRLKLRLHVQLEREITRPDFEVSFHTDTGTMITRFSTFIESNFPYLPAGSTCVDLDIDCLSFQPGRYSVSLCLKTQGPTFYDVLDHCALFETEASDYYGTGKGIHPYFGIVFLPSRWSLPTTLHEEQPFEALR